ncbi:hypothetical protein BS50DRAFT_46987 [Corynespora cassiicola Philippines]|uniref:Secreted protein n=1 Tax=Corynespora cassiicola Philippines TaxID=1448308 RepID=A0A2T2NHL0_CORCC|nr:hypothetical protein BS50DRAFT_46987 [Corynespora cassiicola Philippines]
MALSRWMASLKLVTSLWPCRTLMLGHRRPLAPGDGLSGQGKRRSSDPSPLFKRIACASKCINALARIRIGPAVDMPARRGSAMSRASVGADVKYPALPRSKMRRLNRASRPTLRRVLCVA